MKHVLINYPATLMGAIAACLFAVALEAEMMLLSVMFLVVAWFSEQR